MRVDKWCHQIRELSFQTSALVQMSEGCLVSSSRPHPITQLSPVSTESTLWEARAPSFQNVSVTFKTFQQLWQQSPSCWLCKFLSLILGPYFPCFSPLARSFTAVSKGSRSEMLTAARRRRDLSSAVSHMGVGYDVSHAPRAIHWKIANKHAGGKNSESWQGSRSSTNTYSLYFRASLLFCLFISGFNWKRGRWTFNSGITAQAVHHPLWFSTPKGRPGREACHPPLCSFLFS